MRGRCSQCQKPAPAYDRLAERSWLFVPLWGIPTHFLYAPRRVQCAEHGVVVGQIPWSEGKRPVTRAMMGFLARWARRLSWRETAQVFQTSWEAVYRSVEWFVEWGLAQRQLQQVWSIGIDEIHWGQGKRADQFLTVIYQIDSHCRRLLWVGRRRTQATLRRGLQVLGLEVVRGLRFVCSDMWQPYLSVMAVEASQALHVLDRFHITTQQSKPSWGLLFGFNNIWRRRGSIFPQRVRRLPDYNEFPVTLELGYVDRCAVIAARRAQDARDRRSGHRESSSLTAGRGHGRARPFYAGDAYFESP
jgi:transposase